MSERPLLCMCGQSPKAWEVKLDKARAIEREACAKLATKTGKRILEEANEALTVARKEGTQAWADNSYGLYGDVAAKKIATEIRARK